jgi:3-O-methylgallate 3,4-dioxygenase
MARVAVGIGTSHSPMFALPAELWERYASRDHLNPELIFPPRGWNLSYEEALAVIPDEVRQQSRTLEAFTSQFERCNAALDQLAKTLRSVRPDVTIIISDDQDEWLFEDNMPMFSVFWGEAVRMRPRKHSKGHDPQITKLIADGYGDVPLDVPVHARLGRHLIEFLADHDFDVAHFTESAEEHGGRIVRRLPREHGENQVERVTAVREQGLPHGFAFVIKRLYDNVPVPIVPVFQNTCYPPNTVRPRRAYDFGRVLAEAVAAWDEDITVAVVASGGLSHFIVDEEIDRQLLDALQKKDGKALRGLPPHRLRSGTSESLNWVTLGGAMGATGLDMELVDYVPVYRSEVGTGGGWAFACWA